MLQILHDHPNIQPLLQHKDVDCIGVDGAGDEGPSHFEVQFMWTEWHFKMAKVCAVVTSRFSGGSYLNRVELLNGCLAVGHSNVFIPSTILGSNRGTDGTDNVKLQANLDAAADVYINTVAGTKCAGDPIFLVKGAKDEVSKRYLERRDHLLTFLQGSAKKQSAFKKEFPEEYAYFSKVWTIRNNHIIKNLPENYVFMLCTCYQKNCAHPVCMNGKPNSQPVWFKDGPPLTYVPLPVPDPKRKWGSKCDTCVGACSGHYLSPEDNIKWVKEHGGESCIQPPRKVIGEYFKKPNVVITDDTIKFLAEKTLLSEADINMWIDHLETIKIRRKKGARKAVETKRKKMAEKNKGIQVFLLCQVPLV
jgi:hypothetical protein